MGRVTVGCCKRWSTYLTMAAFFLTGGIEYSVIFPTMYSFVSKFGGEEWLYGLCLAAFSISNLITSPLYGLVFDKTKQTLWIVLVGNLFEIGGNFMYFAAYAAGSPYLILGSRFIVGMGAGAGAALFAELALVTTNKQRTAIYSLFMAMRQLGMVIGPAFNLFLEVTHFNLGLFPVNNLSAPGIFMVLLWILIELLFVFFFFRLPKMEQDLVNSKHKPTVSPNTSVHSTSDYSPKQCITHSPQEDECAPLLQKQLVTSPINEAGYGTTSPTHKLTSPTVNSSVSIAHESNKYPQTEPVMVTRYRGCTAVFGRFRRHWLFVLSEMLREEIVALLGVLLVTFFNQTTIETMFVPMSKKLLHWPENAISFFFSGAGLEIILAFVVVSIVSRKIDDRWLLLIGLVFEVAGYGWFLGFIGNATSDTPGMLWRFVVGGVILLWGLPFVIVTGTSLYSKLLPVSIQGFGQGFRRSVFSVGAILGPLWAGGADSFGDTYYILLGVPCCLYVVVLIIMLIAFPRLKEPGAKNQLSSNIDHSKKTEPLKGDSDDKTSPLSSDPLCQHKHIAHPEQIG